MCEGLLLIFLLILSLGFIWFNYSEAITNLMRGNVVEKVKKYQEYITFIPQLTLYVKT